MGTDINGLGTTFQRAWQLLPQNLVIVLPVLVGYVPMVIAMLFMIGAGLGAGFSIAALVRPTHAMATALLILILAVCVAIFLAAFAVIIFISIAQWAVTTAMAYDVWENGHATLQNGWNAFRESWGNLANASLFMFGIAIGALILAIPTLFLSLIAFYVFTLYIAPLIVVGKQPAGAAVAESFRLAARNFWPTAILTLAVYGIPFTAVVLGSLIGNLVFFVGNIIVAAVGLAATVYMSLVVVGHYRELRKSLPDRLPA